MLVMRVGRYPESRKSADTRDGCIAVLEQALIAADLAITKMILSLAGPGLKIMRSSRGRA